MSNIQVTILFGTEAAVSIESKVPGRTETNVNAQRVLTEQEVALISRTAEMVRLLSSGKNPSLIAPLIPSHETEQLVLCHWTRGGKLVLDESPTQCRKNYCASREEAVLSSNSFTCQASIYHALPQHRAGSVGAGDKQPKTMTKRGKKHGKIQEGRDGAGRDADHERQVPRTEGPETSGMHVPLQENGK